MNTNSLHPTQPLGLPPARPPALPRRVVSLSCLTLAGAASVGQVRWALAGCFLWRASLDTLATLQGGPLLRHTFWEFAILAGGGFCARGFLRPRGLCSLSAILVRNLSEFYSNAFPPSFDLFFFYKPEEHSISDVKSKEKRVSKIL